MKNTFVMFLSCVTCGALSFAQPAADKPVWHEDWASAQRDAKRDGKPVFAVIVCRH
jgi:hypothetical protein